MVHAVLPAGRAPCLHVRDRRHKLVRTPATLLALVKDNLNAAEDEVERRRWLFAHEAENQGDVGQGDDGAPGAEGAVGGASGRGLSRRRRTGSYRLTSARRSLHLGLGACECRAPTPRPAHRSTGRRWRRWQHRIPTATARPLRFLMGGTLAPECWG